MALLFVIGVLFVAGAAALLTRALALPRLRMSSVNDVSVSCCAIFGSPTNVPLPWRRTR